MKKVTVLIVEDEQHNSRMLLGMLSSIRPDWNVLAVLESVSETVSWLKEKEMPQLILMDIQLSDGISFSIFKEVELPASCKIIFTTAYDEYALKAFKVNSIDYLLKPIKEQELETAFRKFEETLSVSENVEVDSSKYSQLLESLVSSQKSFRTRFLISGINEYKKVDVADIAYFYSDNKLTYAVTFDGKENLLDYNLEQLENELDVTYFFRANRKCILHVNSLAKVQNEVGSKLKVTTNPEANFEIIISRLKASEFKKWMGK